MARLLALALLAVAGCTTLQLETALGEPVADPPGLPIEQAWDRDVNAAFGPSAAVVTGRFVVVGTRRGEVVVLDAATGRIEGAAEVGESVEGRVALSPGGGVVYAPVAEARGGVRAVDVRSGQTEWYWRDGGGVEGGVVRVGGVVVAPTRSGLVAGLDAASGEQRWGRERAAGAQILAPPLALGADVIVADDRGTVVCYEAATGAERWVAEVGEPVYEAPVAEGEAVYVATTRGSLVRLDAASGSEAWRIRAEDGIRLSPAAPRAGAVAVGGTDGAVRLLDAATGAERWRWHADGNVTAPPLWLGDHLAVGTHDERLVLLEAASGDEVWSTDLRGRVKSALAVGGSRLIVLTEPRNVVAFQTAP